MRMEIVQFDGFVDAYGNCSQIIKGKSVAFFLLDLKN
jgi:hypothetical protein